MKKARIGTISIGKGKQTKKYIIERIHKGNRETTAYITYYRAVKRARKEKG